MPSRPKALIAATALGCVALCASAPVSLQADPHAKAVVSSTILPGNVGNAYPDPTKALGAPDELYVSMGGPGAELVLDMGETTPVVDGPGPDLAIREIGAVYGGVDESHRVFVSNSTNLDSFVEIGTGRALSLLDISPSGLASARYIRLVDIATESLHVNTPGSDIDSVTALHAEGNAPAPEGLQVIPTGQGLLLRWQASSLANVTSYAIRRSPDGRSFNSAPDVTVSALETAWLDPVTRVTNLWYAVSALVSGGESSLALAEAKVVSLIIKGPEVVHLGDDVVPTWEQPNQTNTLAVEFSLAALPPGPVAELELELFNVDYSATPLILNGALPGKLPVQTAESWLPRTVAFPPAFLLAGANRLQFFARNSSGGLTGAIDDYQIRQARLWTYAAGAASATARITSIKKLEDTVSLEWVVEQSPSLTPAQWEAVSAPLSATNWTGPAAASPSFYRLRGQ